jgi:cyclophilin family peptidyl-prolyl cis-trans isomerase
MRSPFSGKSIAHELRPRHALRIVAFVAFFMAAFSACAQNQRVEIKTSMAAARALPRQSAQDGSEFSSICAQQLLRWHDLSSRHRRIHDPGRFQPGMRQKTAQAPTPNEAGIALKAGLRNEMGTIAMARTPNPHSAAQFINVKNNDFLDFGGISAGYGYAVFGRVVEGMNTVMRIAKTPTGTSGPYENVRRPSCGSSLLRSSPPSPRLNQESR